MKIAEFAYSLNLDEVAHPEPPHLDLHCLPSSVCILNFSIKYSFDLKLFENFLTKILLSAIWKLKS